LISQFITPLTSFSNSSILFVHRQGLHISCKTNIRKRGETFSSNKQVFVNKIKKSTLKFNNTSMKAYCVCLNESWNIFIYIFARLCGSLLPQASVSCLSASLCLLLTAEQRDTPICCCAFPQIKNGEIYLTIKKGSLLIHTIRIM